MRTDMQDTQADTKEGKQANMQPNMQAGRLTGYDKKKLKIEEEIVRS